MIQILSIDTDRSTDSVIKWLNPFRPLINFTQIWRFKASKKLGY